MRICLVCEGVSATEQDTCASCGTRLVLTSEVHFPLRRGEEDAGNPLLGAVIDGKYRVSDVLGKGGMGAVYRAVHQVSLVPVALKILHARHAARAEHRAHFLGEARKAARVIHEHSARVLDVGQDPDGTAYIAMELVEGVNLSEWIHGGDALLPADVVEILDQLCQALAAAHEVGLVHRDLSPRNVMGTVRDGRPFIKILDFGIAKGPLSLLSGEAVGSDAPAGFANPPYSAPEHLAGADVDARADLYSLGVIAYEALTRKLPVEGANARELARATLEGRVRGLRAPSGTPLRLVRLITRLLSCDPRRRPASAKDVLRELQRIRNRRAPVLRAAALGGLLLTLPAFLVTHAGRGTAFLELQPPAQLRLMAERPGPDAPAQELTSADLRELQFRFGGFDASDLRIEAGELAVTDPRPRVTIDGELRLLTFAQDASPEFAALIARLAARPKPADLVFQVPGLPALGHARVLVDDEAPAVDLATAAANPAVLNGLSSLLVHHSDKGTLRRLDLIVHEGERLAGEIDVLGRAMHPTPKAAQLLGQAFGDVAEHHQVTLQLTAVDRAGNQAYGAKVPFETVDLAAPAVLDVTSRRGSRVLTYGPRGASVQVHLDAVEPGLTLVIRCDDDKKEVALAPAGTTQEVLVEAMRDDPAQPFRSGWYTFHVRDGAGNEGVQHLAQYRIESENPSASLRLAPAGDLDMRGLGVIDGEDAHRIVTAGGIVPLAFACNPLYRPVSAELRSGGGPSEPLQLADAEPGRGTLEIGGIPDGEYMLTIHIADDADLEGPPQSWELWVMSQPMVLDLPPVRDLRFPRQLADADLLRFDGDRIGQGPGWQLSPPDVRLLQGRVWSGREGELTVQALPARAARDAEILGGQLVRHGTNVLALELRDPLGRPVDVRLGGQPAPSLALPDGQLAREIARFAYHRDPPVLVQPEVLVEFERPARVSYQSPLPFNNDDAIRLRVASAAIPAFEVTPEGTGSILSFSVPYEDIARAANLTWLTREEVASSPIAEVVAQLATPADDFEVKFNVRPIRSSLQPKEWQKMAPNRGLAPPLRTIRMVPVLGPEGGLYEDPVPEDLPSRADFRPQAPLQVHNIGDFYLQEGEMTRAQYDALITFAASSTSVQRLSKLLIHAADPLGEERLRALRPLIFEHDRAGWTRAVEEGPDRPVTGVGFFQAYTIARIAGVALRGDPALLRLPMGVELELAALGSEDRHPGALNGCSRPRLAPPLRVLRYLEFEKLRHDFARWPPTLEESRAAGDAVVTVLGEPLVALDFGVREWVMDLPLLPEGLSAVALQEWIADHKNHLKRASEFAEAAPSTIEALGPHVERNGVVRGVATGETACLVEAISNERPLADGGAPLPMTVPGVVRILVLRRDGLGLCDELDPHLRDIGFRLAGGEKFVVEEGRQ